MEILPMSYARHLSSLFFLPLFTLFAALQTAEATFPTGCHHPIEVEAHIENNCDGTVTAEYYYNNPNTCFLEFLGHCIIPCGPKHLPVGTEILGDGGLLSVNIMYPGDIGQGQETLFQPGFHFSHELTFLANEEPLTWKLWHNPLLNSPQYAVADPKETPQTCGVEIELLCLEEGVDGDGQPYSKVKYIARNFNTKDLVLPIGEGTNEFDHQTNVGQPTEFPAWPGEVDFTLDSWTPSPAGTSWKLTNDGNTEESEVVTQGDFNDPSNLCSFKPLTPSVSCVYVNPDDTYTAWFGYENRQSTSIHIPAGTDEVPYPKNIVGLYDLPSGTLFDPATPVVDQPEDFAFGRHRGVMSLTWEESEANEARWFLQATTHNPGSPAVAAIDALKACQPVMPLACIELTQQGNLDGYLTAKFGYSNSNLFDISLDPALIALSDKDGASVHPDSGNVPNIFKQGGENPVFHLDFADEDAITWDIAGASQTASIGTARLCKPEEYQAPTCNIQGSTDLSCGGDITSTTLVADGVAQGSAGGRAVAYTWQINCGEDGVDSTYSISGDQNEVLNFSSVLPGLGEEIPFGNCTVTLGVSDDFGASSCSVEITSDACGLDCADQPFVDGATPANLTDECGICYPAGDPLFNTTCADCAGTPNGSAVTDEFSACCLPGELDQCGVCNGNNDTCLQCVESDISGTQFDLDGESERLRRIVGNASRMLRRESRRYSGQQRNRMRRVARRIRNRSADLHEQNWALIWSVPSVVQNCGNQELCLSVSNAPVISEVDQNLDQLQRLVRRGVRRLRRFTGNPRIGTRLIVRSLRVRFAAETPLNQFPLEVSQCGIGTQDT